MPPSVGQAVVDTHAWFERHSGWAPPDPSTLVEWMADGICLCPDGCEVAPAGVCGHGLASWWLVLIALDRPDRSPPVPPERLIPHPGRLDPARDDYVEVLEAHHRAVIDGEAGYLDPRTGLFALTARTLWERGSCCTRGCRHCPWAQRQ